MVLYAYSEFSHCFIISSIEVTTVQSLLKRVTALCPIFPSSVEIEHLRGHNDFWRVCDTADIEPRNDSEAVQKLGSEDGEVRVSSRRRGRSTRRPTDASF